MTRERIRSTFDLRYAAISPNWLPLCKGCSGLFNPWENSWFWAFMYNNLSKVFEACYSAQLLTLYLDLPLNAIGAGQDTTVYKSFCKFKVCIWSMRRPGALSLSKTAVTSGGCAPDPASVLNINCFTGISQPYFWVGKKFKKKNKCRNIKRLHVLFCVNNWPVKCK